MSVSDSARRLVLAACIGGAMCTSAQAQIIWNEFVQGDLSDSRFAPTPLAVSIGSNLLLGNMAGDLGGGVIDRDYFSITIPQGMQLSQIILVDYFSLDPFAFLAIQPGSIFPNDPILVEPGDLLGWTHLNVGQVGNDVLAEMGTNGQGFTPPLPSGVYSFWAQQLGDPTDYTLDFVVIPAPSTGCVALAGLCVAMRRRRQSRI